MFLEFDSGFGFGFGFGLRVGFGFGFYIILGGLAIDR